jgi:Trp operon repressor
VRNQQQSVNTRVQAIADWDKFLSVIPKNISNTDLAQFLLEPKLNTIILNNVRGSNDIKAMVIELVSTPEYQLC